METDFNFKSKKALKEAVAAGEQVTFYRPWGVERIFQDHKTILIEGPHSPEPHKWYAVCEAVNGVIVSVK